MKFRIYYLLLIFTFGFFTQKTYSAIALPKAAQQYLQTARIDLDGGLDGREPGCNELREYLKKNWIEVLDNLQSIAPTDIQKCVIVVGCEELPDSEYPDFLQKLGDLFSEGKISKNVAEQAILAEPGREGFLGNNWMNPKVRSFLENVRAKTGNDLQMQSGINDMLSGKASEDSDSIAGSSLPEKVITTASNYFLKTKNAIAENKLINFNKSTFPTYFFWWIFAAMVVAIGVISYLLLRRK